MTTIDQLKQETKVPVVIANQEGFITHVNESFESAFGWKMDQIVGKPLTTLIPRNLRDAHHLGFSRFLTTERPTLLNQPLKLKIQTKDGHEWDAEHTIVAEKREGQWMFGATIRPLGRAA